MNINNIKIRNAQINDIEIEPLKADVIVMRKLL